MVTDLTALIERIEAASEGTRELDADVYEALGYSIKRHPARSGTAFRATRSRSFVYLEHGHWISMGHLTTSIDAAVALIERMLPQVFWKVDSFGVAFVAPRGTVTAHVQASTPALALILALLRALQHQDPSHAE